MPISGSASGAGSGVGVVKVDFASNGSNVVIASVTNGTAFGGGTLATGQIVLLRDQSVSSENGFYTVPASGAASRDPLLLAGADASGVKAFVKNGSSAGLIYTCTSSPAIAGTNSLTWTLEGQATSAGARFSISPITPAGRTLATAATGFLLLDGLAYPSESIVFNPSGMRSSSTELTVPSSGTYMVTMAFRPVTGSEHLDCTLNGVVQAKLYSQSAANTQPASAACMFNATAGQVIRFPVINGNTDLENCSITVEQISGMPPVVGYTVAFLRARMNPLTATNPTGTAVIGSYASERLLFNEITAISGNAITYNSSTGAFTVKAGVAVGVVANVNKLYSGGIYQMVLRDTVSNVAWATSAASNLGAGGDGSVVGHRREQLRCQIPAQGSDRTYVLEHPGGWNSVASYWGNPPFVGVANEVLADWTNIEFTQLGSSPTVAVTLAHVRANSCVSNTYAAGQGNVVTWTNKTQDPSNSFVAATGTFTAPRTGYYQFKGQWLNSATSGAAAGTRVGAIISINGAAFGAGTPIHSLWLPYPNNANIVQSFNETKFMNAGDTAVIRAFLDSATSATITSNANFDHLEIDELQ